MNDMLGTVMAQEEDEFQVLARMVRATQKRLDSQKKVQQEISQNVDALERDFGMTRPPGQSDKLKNK